MKSNEVTSISLQDAVVDLAIWENATLWLPAAHVSNLREIEEPTMRWYDNTPVDQQLIHTLPLQVTSSNIFYISMSRICELKIFSFFYNVGSRAHQKTLKFYYDTLNKK